MVGGEVELALLLQIFPEGVEELDGAFAVYADEPPIGFDAAEADDVAEGWEDAWRSFHHGVRVGRLWIGPPWETAPHDAVAVVIDPGRAFGTGAHATTRLCLEALDDLPRSSLLDVGCGSGVLAIAASKVGFAPVTGVDLDPAAVDAARVNAQANGVELDARLGDATTTALPHAETAVANVSLDAIEAVGSNLDCETLVTSGYLDGQRPRLSFAHDRTLARDGWAADVWRATAAG